MNNARAAAPSPRVLALLDSASGADQVLEWSSALAGVLRRELQLVFIESTLSLQAAELPITQVLAGSDAGWRPFTPQDVEQGFRAHAARLREQAARVSVRHAVNWSLRVLRGRLPQAALALEQESDLVILAGPPPWPAPLSVPSAPSAASTRAKPGLPRRPVVGLLADGGADPAQSARARQMADLLARTLGGVVEPVPALGEAPASPAALIDPQRLARVDVLVAPRRLTNPQLLSTLRCTVLIVG